MTIIETMEERATVHDIERGAAPALDAAGRAAVGSGAAETFA